MSRETASPILLPPDGQTTFRAGGKVMRFVFDKTVIDWSTLVLNIKIHSSNATSILTRAGAAGLFEEMRFKMGGASYETIADYGGYVSHQFASHGTYGTNTDQDGGLGYQYGRLRTLPATEAAAIWLRVPLLISPVVDKLRLNLDQFQANTILEFSMASNSKALTDTAEVGSYSIPDCYLSYYGSRSGELTTLTQGAVINSTNVMHTVVSAGTTGIVALPLECSNCTSVMVSANTSDGDYIVADDRAFQSNIALMSSMNLRLGGLLFPDEAVGGRDFPSESYNLSLAGYNKIGIHSYINDSFVRFDDFISATVREGYLTIPLFGRTPKEAWGPGGVTPYRLGTPIAARDTFHYKQSAATAGETISVWSRNTRKATYNGTALVLSDIWPSPTPRRI